jgi:cytochrome c556
MRNSPIAKYGVPLGVAGAILTVMLAAPSAQRRNRADNAALGAPVATNTILQYPEAYYGKPVTISAGVEQMLSKTTFLVDQRKAVGPNDVKSIGTPILVIAPYLTSHLEQKQYLLMRGQIVKLEAAALARVAADYTLDLAPEVSAKYQGQPVLLAASVINSRYAELAKKPIPPPSPADVSLTAAMKIISPSFAALRTAAQESKADAVAQNVATLTPAFTQTEAIWDGLGQGAASTLAREARGHIAAIESAAAAGNWDGVKASAGALNQLCQNCHATYRERLDDGTFRLKTASPQ